MIEIRNLYKRYHNHHGSDWVLKDINLTIPRGVSVGLIGANGAGKSTLLRLIAGMDTPERGEVVRSSRVSWPVGVTGGMQNNMTGRQNVKFVARVQGSRSQEVQRVIEFVEDFAEIGEAFDEPVKTYSSGMRSRVSFGLSLAFDFDVYISDEATAVGDRAFKEKAKALFRSKVGKSSLIMVSHSEGILKDLCQAGVYIKEGEAFWFDDINAAIKTYHRDSDAKKAARASKLAKAPATANRVANESIANNSNADSKVANDKASASTSAAGGQAAKKAAPTKAVPGNTATAEADEPLPSDIPSAKRHLQQCRQKLKKAKEAQATAEEQQFLPYIQQFIKKDVANRNRKTVKARKHLEALEQAQQHVSDEVNNSHIEEGNR